MVKSRSPGPAIYQLPPVTGHKGHDPSRPRAPTFSFAPPLPYREKERSPGPKYEVAKLNQHGPTGAPCFSLKAPWVNLKPFNPPGPGAHNIAQRYPYGPVFSLKGRLQERYGTIGPGPLGYSLPSTLGHRVPNMHANGAFSLKPRIPPLRFCSSPGPAVYPGNPTNNYKNRLPQYSMAPQYPLIQKCKSPGPAAYLPGRPHCTGGPFFSLGRPATDAHIPYIIAEDDPPCTRV